MKTLIVLIGICISLSSPRAAAQTYSIDPGHTAVTSKVMRFGVVKVVGRFNSVSGRINFDSQNPAATTGEIVIQTDSYSANNIEGEKAIKSPAFLDVAKFPEIKFLIKELTKSPNGFNVIATLTLHGISKDITFPVTIHGPLPDLPTGKKSIGIAGMVTINRQDFAIGMSRKTPGGEDIIGQQVEIEVNALALAQ
jgi:polyisoprenoid-binding protein YceI